MEWLIFLSTDSPFNSLNQVKNESVKLIKLLVKVLPPFDKEVLYKKNSGVKFLIRQQYKAKKCEIYYKPAYYPKIQQKQTYVLSVIYTLFILRFVRSYDITLL